MIADRLLFARRALPLGVDQSARWLPWVFAFLAYVTALSGVGLSVLDGTLRAAEHALATSLTLQVPADASDARLETVLAVLRQTSGIVSVHLLEPAETARLLEPWLGPSVPLDELPVPRLIDLRADPNRGPDLDALRAKLVSVVPDARLDDRRAWPPGMRAAARRIEGILATGIAVALLLIALSAVFAVRTALWDGRSVIKLLHVLGAADAAIARGFAIGLLRLGLLGGIIGAVAALLTILALKGAGSVVQLPMEPAAYGLADWRVWVILVGVVPAGGLIAMASAWVAVLRRLAIMP